MSRTMPLDQLDGAEIAVRHHDTITVGVCHLVRLGPGPRITVLLRPEEGDDLYLHAPEIKWMVPTYTDASPVCEATTDTEWGLTCCSLQPHVGTEHLSIGLNGHTPFTAEELIPA